MISNCKEESKKNSCCGSNNEYQNYPTKGALKNNMNKSLDYIRDKLGENDDLIYSYVLTSVEFENSKFKQGGCGPNFQGGRITLCTCKHYMRTYKNIRKKDNLWIAGFTSSTLFDSKNHYLFYLMNVEKRFKSHKELWDSLNEEITKEKNANKYRLGDIYKPKSSDEFSEEGYKKPIENHEHKDCWKDDIDYKSGKSGKRPALLVGDPKKSYLWSKPEIHYKAGIHPRHSKKWKGFEDFIRTLESE